MLLQIPAPHAVLINLLGIEGVAVVPPLLRSVHGQVGALQQGFCTVTDYGCDDFG